MRLLPIFLTSLLMLSACGTPAQPTIPPAESSAPTSTAVALGGTLQTSVLATTWKNSLEGTVLFPIDPTSGTPLPDYSPISLGQSSYPAFSPDRQTLAMVSFPREDAYDGSLLLIDLQTWKTRALELKLTGWVTTMTFSPDGKQLAIAHGAANYQITMINVEKGVITAQSQTDSYVSRLSFTKNGEALMLYGPTLYAANNVGAGAPRVMLLNAADLSSRWSATLDNIRDGVFPKDETITQPELHEPGNSFYFNPGITFAPDQDVLYIVHADSEQLTTVNFESQKVETVKIQPKLTWFDKLLSTDVAHAKGENGTSKQTAVSPDGRFLYVVGAKDTVSIDQGNVQLKTTPLGLEIIQTNDGSRVSHIATDATELSLSPDGHLLYLRNWIDSTPWTEIFDTSKRQVIAHKEALYATPVLLTNGGSLLASTYSTSPTSNRMSILQADGSTVLSAWTDRDYVSWLNTP
ncbi:MAG TPA: hypothetical protein VLE49_22865 [Anaerolineales bacterium]|nr:hypothetical protein [Anaerolineales bacterium]